jgi:hypothetical protein
MPYYRGQGKLYVAERNILTSYPLAFRYVGNVPELKVAFEVTKLEHKESYSGNNLTDLQLITEKKSSMSCVLENFVKENLALLFNGTDTSLTGITPVTAYPLLGSTTPAVGQLFMLPRKNVSAVVIKDSTGAPKTLVLNTNYTIDLKSGMIEIIDITTGAPWVGPLTADFTPAVSVEVAMFNAAATDKWFRFIGLNTANNSVPCVVDLFKVQLDPTKEFTMIGDDVAKFALEGSVLMDPLRLSSDTLGQFGSVTLLA